MGKTRRNQGEPGKLSRGRGALLVAVVAFLAIVGLADLSAPPRYDGAGYAVLAQSLASGQGYRAIDHPDAPRHAHFPPGYPACLATVWSLAGPSPVAAHLASVLCTLGATLLAGAWFVRMCGRSVALPLSLALAVNWIWTRTGSGIQSEPLFELLGQLAILCAARSRHWPSALALGLVLAACLLTRQVAIGLVLAVLLDMALRRRWREAGATVFVIGLFVGPWLAWIYRVREEGSSQISLLAQGQVNLAEHLFGQVAFYVQRIPDQLTGPFVEVATIFRDSSRLSWLANLWAVVTTTVILFGWISVLRNPRRRLAGLIPLLTLALLVIWPYTEAGRFLVPLIPCFLVGAVEGLTVLSRFLATRLHVADRLGPRRARRWAATIVLIAALPYTAYSLLAARHRGALPGDRDFDAACAWLSANAQRPGPVLTRHPGEVFLQTGRKALEVSTSERPGAKDEDAGAIEKLIDRYRVAYLLIDDQRYANAPASPLARFVAERPEGINVVWPTGGEGSRVRVYEVAP